MAEIRDLKGKIERMREKLDWPCQCGCRESGIDLNQVPAGHAFEFCRNTGRVIRVWAPNETVGATGTKPTHN